MVIEFSWEAPKNAWTPISSRELTGSKLTERRFAAPKNARRPNEVTLLGIVIEVSEVEPLKALLPMEITVPGITASTQPELVVTTLVSIVNVPPSVQFTTWDEAHAGGPNKVAVTKATIAAMPNLRKVFISFRL
tara:strand:+ start:967 stop:1368 length:402 start_codon:yes stop_codon:yes gene_type:complete